MNTFSFLKSTYRFLLTTIPNNFKRLSCTSSNMSPIKIKIFPAPPIIPKTYMDKNEGLKRAISPHLSIYKPELTSMMSISVRMTGLTLGIMAWVVGITKFLSDENVDYYVDKLKSLELDDCYWTAAKTIIIFPFAFHYVAGFRHLLFDTSKLLEKPQYYATGYVAIALSIVLALCLSRIEDIRNKMEEMRLEKEEAAKKNDN